MTRLTAARPAPAFLIRWRRWRLRNQPVPCDGLCLDLHEERLFSLAMTGFGDAAGTRQLTRAEALSEIAARHAVSGRIRRDLR